MGATWPRVTWYRFTRTFPRRRVGYLTVVLLVGLVGGVALAAVAGARRTQSAFPAYLAASKAGDLQVSVYLSGSSPLTNVYDPRVTARLARLRLARHVAVSVNSFVAPLTATGEPDLSPPLQNNEVQTVGGLEGEYWSQDRVVADQSRTPAALLLRAE